MADLFPRFLKIVAEFQIIHKKTTTNDFEISMYYV